jgi:hypothetical protein
MQEVARRRHNWAQFENDIAATLNGLLSLDRSRPEQRSAGARNR